VTANGSYDAIVIGGGPGGLACAALLSKWGARTLLLEKNHGTGGKAVTPLRNGFRYELGPKLQVPMRDPGFAALFRELGIEDRLGQILLLDGSSLSYKGRSGEYKTVVAPQTSEDPSLLFDLMQLDAGERTDALGVLAELVMLAGPELDALDDVSMEDWLAKRRVPHALYNYMAMHANASLAEPIDRVAASEQIRILQQIATRGGGGYYRGGFGRVLDDVADAIRANGGEIRTGARVGEIRVENGRATGVETADGAFRAPIVVSSAGIQPTMLKLVGESRLPADYAAYVKRLEPGWGFATVRYFLGRPAMPHKMYMIWSDESWWNTARARRVWAGHEPDEVIGFITVPANFDPTMAPPGQQCLIAGTICSPDPKAGEIAMLYRKLDELIAKLFPDAWAAVERRETDGPAEVSEHTRDSVLPGQGGECVGIGQVVGQCGTKKPSPRTPIPGLFLAGCDAGGACMGTHQATESGMNVARMVRAALAARKH
jgi:phytoene dehydrogenase-like protein